MHSGWQWLFLAAAGLLAGVIGSAGGITSLVAYPALLATGLPALAANVTNSVALLGSGAGAALRARPDLTGRGASLRAWLLPMVLLSLAGAALLLATPSALFDRVVPFLVAIGSLTLLLQPSITRRRDGRPAPRPAVAAGGAAVALYNGYFGAGSGILLIAVLLLTREPVLYRANAAKNVILVAADLLPAVLFAVLGRVVWSAMWPLAIGAIGGGLLGPSLARRAPATLLRIAIASCGFVLAGWLLFSD